MQAWVCRGEGVKVRRELGVHFVSERLCSFSTTHTRPAVSTSCHPRRALIFQVLSLCAWLLLMGLQIHSGSHASTFTTELFPAPPPALWDWVSGSHTGLELTTLSFWHTSRQLQHLPCFQAHLTVFCSQLDLTTLWGTWFLGMEKGI